MRITNMTRNSDSSQNARVRGQDSRGVALITTMLLLTLMIAMTLGMVIALTSDTLITGYYKTYRSSFYAGDSGVNIVRQYMLNQLVSNATLPSERRFLSALHRRFRPWTLPPPWRIH